MKSVQLFIVFFLLIASASVFAQSVLDKGNYQLSGDISFMKDEINSDNYTDKSIYFYAAPQYSYFVIDNLLIGGEVSFNYSEYEWNNENLDIYRSVGVGPLLRYYFRANKFFPFIGAALSYNKYLSEDDYGISTELNAGVDIFLAKSVALEPYVSYRTMNYYKPESDGKMIAVGLRLNYFIVN